MKVDAKDGFCLNSCRNLQTSASDVKPQKAESGSEAAGAGDPERGREQERDKQQKKDEGDTAQLFVHQGLP